MTDRAIYRDDLADRFKDQVGEKYRPSNGTEGEIFMERWCADCQKDAAHRADPDRAAGCPIFGSVLMYSRDDDLYPTELQYGEDGQPRCTAFEKSSVSEGEKNE